MSQKTTRILRRPEVEARTGLSRSTIYAAISNGTFPKPVQLTVRTVGWPEATIEAWLEARIREGERGTEAAQR